jgi:hypothetical protein
MACILEESSFTFSSSRKKCMTTSKYIGVTIVSCLCTILLIMIHINNARQHVQKIVAGIRSGITSAIDHQLISTSSASEATGIPIPVPCTYRFNCTSVKFSVDVHLFGRSSATEGTGLGRYKHDVCKKGSWVLPQLAASLQSSFQHPNRPHVPTIGARLDFAD